MSNSPTSILVLLRAREGENLADLLPFAQPGAHVGLGRGVAVIGQALACPTVPGYMDLAELQRLAREAHAPQLFRGEESAPLAQGADDLPPLEEHLAQVEALGAALRDDQAEAEAEFGDAYQGARDDLAIWKRRALGAEEAVRQKDQVIEHLTLEAQGEARLGEPYIPEEGQELRGAGAGGDLLLVLERLVREVIQREAVCGGVIARAIAEGRP